MSVKQLDPSCYPFLSFTINSFQSGAIEPGSSPILDARD